MKFSLHRDAGADSAHYQERIAELEAELEAAHLLIAGQQQILESNLSAVCKEDLEDEDNASDPVLPPLRISQPDPSNARPPIPLPDFGPPLVDIAQCVLYAATPNSLSDETVVTAPASPLPASVPDDTDAPIA